MLIQSFGIIELIVYNIQLVFQKKDLSQIDWYELQSKEKKNVTDEIKESMFPAGHFGRKFPRLHHPYNTAVGKLLTL